MMAYADENMKKFVAQRTQARRRGIGTETSELGLANMRLAQQRRQERERATRMK